MGEATVGAILTAAEQLLERDGLERLTTNHVAERAGVSIGSLYQYFPNKEALLGALQVRYAEDTLARVREVLADGQYQPIRTVIVRLGEAILAAQQAQRPIHRALIDARTAAGAWERYRSLLDQHVELLVDFLVQHPDVAVADAHAAAFILVHATEGVIEAVTERPGEDAVRIALQSVELLARFVEKR